MLRRCPTTETMFDHRLEAHRFENADHVAGLRVCTVVGEAAGLRDCSAARTRNDKSASAKSIALLSNNALMRGCAAADPKRVVGNSDTPHFEHSCFDNLSDRSGRRRKWEWALRFGSFGSRRYSFAAASSAAMSNFTICIIAAIALGCFRISPIFSGTICQHRPNLSVSQPQAMGLPPSSSLSQ